MILSQTAPKNRVLRIRRLPTASILNDDIFEMVEEPLPEVADGQILVRAIYFSVDAGSRASLDTQSDYVLKRNVGESPMGSNAIGEVIASRHLDYPVGSIVSSAVTNYQSHLLFTPDKDWGVKRIQANGIPLNAFAGILGITGFTSYAGIFGPFTLKAGETFVVSAAAGAVGMAAGQFAKIVGARVIGIAGGQEKCKFLVDNAGFDAALDYRCNLDDQLRKTCPDGIDFYFENVGGEVQRTVFSHMNTLGRIAICGQIAQYSGAGEPGGPNLMNVVLKSLSIRGFLSVQDYPELFEKFEKDVRQWFLEGRVTNHVTITQGLENASSAINNLVTGRNIGKQLLQVAPEPS